MVDDLVGEVDPATLWKDLHQFLFNLRRGVAFSQPKASGDAENVRIHDHAFSLAKADAENDIGRLAGRAGNGDQLSQRLRNLTAELLDHLAGGALDGFGLVVKEAGGADQLFEFWQCRLGHGCRGREAAE